MSVHCSSYQYNNHIFNIKFLSTVMSFASEINQKYHMQESVFEKHVNGSPNWNKNFHASC